MWIPLFCWYRSPILCIPLIHVLRKCLSTIILYYRCTLCLYFRHVLCNWSEFLSDSWVTSVELMILCRFLCDDNCNMSWNVTRRSNDRNTSRCPVGTTICTVDRFFYLKNTITYKTKFQTYICECVGVSVCVCCICINLCRTRPPTNRIGLLKLIIQIGSGLFTYMPLL